MKNNIYLFFISLIFLLSGCYGFKLQSFWKGREIVVDGNDTEWQDKMARYQNLSFGICNDEEYIYICLAATDKKTKAQLMGLFRQNFTIWFNADGTLNQQFGLRFSNESPYMDESLVGRIRFIKTPVFQVIANEMMKNFEIEILKNDYPVAMLSDAQGIDVAASVTMNGRKLVYEIKIPLKKTENQAFAIESSAGKLISFGLSTSEVDINSVREQLVRDYINSEKQNTANHQKNEAQFNRGGHGRYNDSNVNDFFGIDPFMSREVESFKCIHMHGKIKLAKKIDK